MTEHERNTDFLRRIILFADPEQHRNLRADISQVCRKQHCVQRAVQLMILLALISAVAFAYGAVFEEDFLFRSSRFMATFICALGLASSVCLATFLMLLLSYRRELNRLLEKCRQLIIKVMEDRLGSLGTTSLSGSQSEGADLGLGRSLMPLKSAPESLPSLGD